jgi:feruloyl-CoA synthase
MNHARANPVFRPFHFGVQRAHVHTENGNTYVMADQDLRPFASNMTEHLIYWADKTPDQTLFAQRDPTLGGDWRRISFAQALDAARCIGQALLDRGLSAQRPLVILSENSLAHAQLALGAMYAGIAFCPVSPAYSLLSKDFDKLRHVLETLTPGLVFASDWQRFQLPIEALVGADVEVILEHDLDAISVRGHKITPFSRLLDTKPTASLERAMLAIDPDTIVKFLFTSGSTKLPKAVINTQRMICSNQQQIAQSMPTAFESPPVLVDWLPWHHTAGGNHDFFMCVSKGGSFYIDEGKPTPTLIGETLRNLREIAPTWYFNVPVGYEALAREMQDDDQLRRNFFSQLRSMLYAGAALSQAIQDALYDLAERAFGERIPMTAGLGMTESSPFALFVTTPHSLAGHVGLPTPGMKIKLIPVGDKLEIRYKGPNITPGYWRNPQATDEAFDEEGYFCTGDAVAWIDETNKDLGLKFDGRIAEDFKLATGTFVSVGPLRAKINGMGAPYVQDSVITGLNKNEVGAMLVVTPAIRQLADLPESATMDDVSTSPQVKAWLQDLVNRLAQTATGSASRINRIIILTQPPSLDKGEITDKGSLNQRAILTNRFELVQALHADSIANIAKPQNDIPKP